MKGKLNTDGEWSIWKTKLVNYIYDGDGSTYKDVMRSRRVMAARENDVYNIHRRVLIESANLTQCEREWRFRLRNNAHRRMTTWMGKA